MKKYILSSLFLWLPIMCFAQSNTIPSSKANEKQPELKNAESIKTENPAVMSPASTNQKLKDQQYSPSQFYIINDKPVTREEYMNHLLKKDEKENIKSDK